MPSVLIPLAQGCEELEAVTLIDLLRRGGIEVVTAGLDDRPVTASRGVVLMPDMTLDDALARDYDMVVLPGGGAGADNLDNDNRIHTLLRRMIEGGKFAGAICAAPKVLANAGILEGKRATSYPGVLDKMQPSGVTYTGEAVVRDGNILTSRGPGTAMDFALTLIETLVGKDKRDEVEKALVRS
jgi:protein deglycase